MSVYLGDFSGMHAVDKGVLGSACMTTTYMITCVSGLQVFIAMPSEMCCALKHSAL